MNVLLINLKEPKRFGQKKTIIPPFGLWKIKNFLNNRGIMCKIIDLNIGQRIMAIPNEPDIIGLSVKFSTQHDSYMRLGKALRENTRAEIIAGGFHASAIPRPKFIDEIVKGSGEQYFAKRINDFYFYQPLNIPIGILEKYWKKKAPHDLQSKTGKWIPFETSRGCNNRCNYCGVLKYWGKWTPFELPAIDNNLKLFKGQGIEELFIEDDNISYDEIRFMQLINIFKKYKLYWSCPNGLTIKSLLDDDVLKILSKAKYCWRLSLPFETGSERTAKLMNLKDKYVDRDKAKELVKKLKDMGIKTCGFFIIGYPEETADDVQRTLDYANSIPLDQRNIYIATPYPNTKLYEKCKKNGWLKYDNEKLYKRLMYKHGLIDTPMLKAKEIMKIKKKDRDEAIKRLKLENKKCILK